MMTPLHWSGLAGLGLLLACGGSPAENNPGETAELRMMNAAVGSAPLDLVVDGQILLTAVEYERSSAGVEVPSGARSLVLRQTGQSASLVTSQMTLVTGARYNVIASGTGGAVRLTR